MPLYMYQCNNCDYYFEESHPIDERRLPCEKLCPECGEKEIDIRIGAPIVNLGFRGSTVQSKAPTEFKEQLTRIKNGLGKTGRVKGIE